MVADAARASKAVRRPVGTSREERHGRLRPEVAVHGLFVVFGFVIAAFFPFFAIYLQGRGLSADEIGVVIAVTALARIVGNPIWGHYADTRIGRLTAFQIGTIGAGSTALAMNLVHGAAGDRDHRRRSWPRSGWRRGRTSTRSRSCTWATRRWPTTDGSAGG